MPLADRIAEAETAGGDWWDISKGKITRDEFPLLADKLRQASGVRHVDLAGASLGSDGAKAVAEGIAANPSLTELYLCTNGIRAEGARALSEALKHNSTVRKLDLDDNGVGNAGAKALAEALKVNRGLQVLYLGGLKSKACLATSKLQQGYIFDEGDRMICLDGVKALAEALKVNRTLTELTLGGNQFTDEGAACLRDGLKANPVIQELDLDDCELSEDVVLEIEGLLDRNKARRAAELRPPPRPAPAAPMTAKSPAKSALKSTSVKPKAKKVQEAPIFVPPPEGSASPTNTKVK